MTVSDADRAKMRRIAADLAAGETDDSGTPAQRRTLLSWINARRADIGTPPLDDRAPEEGLYERARSLGMARIDRWAPFRS
ncbi:MAG: hypothetical protein WD225_05790 [Ilumatobacteraceae bacterium]